MNYYVYTEESVKKNYVITLPKKNLIMYMLPSFVVCRYKTTPMFAKQTVKVDIFNRVWDVKPCCQLLIK